MFGIDTYAQKETLFLFGGVALSIMGAGLILSIPEIRKVIQKQVKEMKSEGTEGISEKLGGLLPDVQRYMKMRAM